MKTYHIMFYESGPTSEGQNFEAVNPHKALIDFYHSYPKAKFIGMHDIEALNSVQVNRKIIQDQVERDEQYLSEGL